MKYDKLPKDIKDRVDAIRHFMCDAVGIVNPEQHFRLDTIDERILMIIDPWPIGVDKRSMDIKIQRLGASSSLGLRWFHLYPRFTCGPYSSAYVLGLDASPDSPTEG